MPTWPKDTKASIANVNQGSDQISQARADILQNITNVNTIIDTFDLQPDSAGQPANGDLLQYNSTTSTWQPVAQSSISSGAAEVGYLFSRDGTIWSHVIEGDGNYGRLDLDENYSPSWMSVDTTSNYFDLDQGTYQITIYGDFVTTCDVGESPTIDLFNLFSNQIQEDRSGIDYKISLASGSYGPVYTRQIQPDSAGQSFRLAISAKAQSTETGDTITGSHVAVQIIKIS
jgi:hypothetical protein